MRTAFINELIRCARDNRKIFLVVGDLGYSVVEPFAEEFPERFLNVGIAEQNMTGLAAGLASEGYQVFTYSIANFPTIRCAEQIRNDVCYHNLAVTVVAVGGGMAYGALGYSHHGVQDIALMRTFPNMAVLAPGDPGEVRESMEWILGRHAPSYLRLGKAGEPDLHRVRGLANGPLRIRGGSADLALVTTGGMLGVGIEVADRLKAEGYKVALFSMPMLKPVTAAYLEPLSSYERIISVEEHGNVGGLASLLRDYLPRSITIEGIGVPESTAFLVGSQSYLRRAAQIDGESVFVRAKAVFAD